MLSPKPLLILIQCWVANVALTAGVGFIEGWTYETGGLIFSSAAMAADGTLYVGSNDRHLHAIAPDGQALWSFETGDWVDSTPAIGEDGAIFFGSWDNFVYALEPDGSLRWEYETGSAVLGSPVLVEGLAIIGSMDGFCYALDAQSGEFIWAYLADTELEASPMHADGRVYLAGYDGTVHCLDAATGEGIWMTDTAELLPAAKPTDERRILASPVPGADGLVLVGTGAGVLYAFDEFGSVAWFFEATAEIDSTPVVDANGDILFGCRDGLLYRLNSVGFLEWTALVGRVYYSAPAIGREHLFYVLGFQGNGITRLYQIDQAGFALDSVDYEAIVDASPLLTPDGFLVVGLFDGSLRQLDPLNPPAQSTWPQFQQDPARLARNPSYWQPYRQWVADWFGPEFAENPESVELTDGDCLPLLAKFALGLDPTQPGVAATSLNLIDGAAELTAWKYVGARDVLTRLESSPDLQAFEVLGAPAVVETLGDFEKIAASAAYTGEPLFLRFQFEEF